MITLFLPIVVATTLISALIWIFVHRVLRNSSAIISIPVILTVSYPEQLKSQLADLKKALQPYCKLEELPTLTQNIDSGTVSWVLRTAVYGPPTALRQTLRQFQSNREQRISLISDVLISQLPMHSHRKSPAERRSHFPKASVSCGNPHHCSSTHLKVCRSSWEQIVAASLRPQLEKTTFCVMPGDTTTFKNIPGLGMISFSVSEQRSSTANPNSDQSDESSKSTPEP